MKMIYTKTSAGNFPASMTILDEDGRHVIAVRGSSSLKSSKIEMTDAELKAMANSIYLHLDAKASSDAKASA